MSGIYGFVRRDGAPVDASELATLRGTLADWGRDGFGEWRDGAAALGQARTHVTPECQFEGLPSHDPGGDFVFTASARLDNREALLRDLGLHDHGHAWRGIPDGDVLMA